MCAESRFDPAAVSPAGAQGIAQIMPATMREIIHNLRWDAAVTAFDPGRAIEAGAYYQGRQRRAWRATGRTPKQRNDLGLGSYNAGLGSLLRAQRLCLDGLLWEDIAPCLPQVTGHHARETKTYVARINSYRLDLAAAGR